MEIKMVLIQCPECHIPFSLSEEFDVSLRKCHNTFYCPKGHKMSYSHKSDEEKLRDQIRARDNEIAKLRQAEEKRAEEARRALIKRQEAARKAAKTRAAKKAVK